MSKILTYLLIFVLMVSFSGCFWKMKHPSEVYSDGNIEKAYLVGTKWLEKYPNDIEARKITGKAALMLGDTLSAYQTWKPALLYFMDRDELISKKTIEFALSLGDLDFLNDIIKLRMEREPIERKRERLMEMSALVQMKKNNALHAYLTVENNIISGNYFDAYDRIREINKVYPKTEYISLESSLRAYLLMREGTDEAASKSMKLLEKILIDPAVSIPVLYISSRIYYEIGQSQKAGEVLERAKMSYKMTNSFNLAIDRLYEDIHKKKNQYDR